MAINERIRFFRNLKGITQKQLGIVAGFPENTADVRMAQYEAGTRTPKSDLVKTLSDVLGVSTMALTVPNIESAEGLMHTLFVLEDLYGLKVSEFDGDVCLRVDPTKSKDAEKLYAMLCDWQNLSLAKERREISQDEYDKWRYNFSDIKG